MNRGTKVDFENNQVIRHESRMLSATPILLGKIPPGFLLPNLHPWSQLSSI